MTLSPILFFGLLEAGLRVGGYGYPTGFFVPLDGKGSYTTNHRFGWRFFPRPLARAPISQILSPKPPGSVRILVLGDSAAMGTPEPSFSFGRILAVMLREQYPGVQFEVVNAAMVAINSHVVREIARDCAAFEPDLFVVYMGNNEVIGPYGPGTVFQHWSPSLRMVRAGLRVKSTRVGQLLSDIAGHLHRDQGAPGQWEGMEMFLNNPVPADDPRLTTVYDSLRRNLTDICGIGRRARARVILSTVAVNLRDCPPFASQHRSGLKPADLATWASLFRAGSELEASNRWPEAVGQFEAAAKLDDRFAELEFHLGQCLLKAGRLAEARKRFELARDLDVLRFRADARINAIIREVARQQEAAGVRLVDAEQALMASAPDSKGIPGEDLFYEHVHLRFDGNYLLARTVLDQLPMTLPQLATLERNGPIPSRQRCAELLALTPWDDYQSADKILDMTSRAPFTNQYNHSLRLAAARKTCDDLRALATTPEAEQAAWQTYEAALAKAPHDGELHRNFGMLAVQVGRFDVAAEHFRIAAEEMPGDTVTYGYLGNALAAQGRIDEAIGQFQKVLEIKPDLVDAHNKLANLLADCGRVEEAIAHFQKALEIKPDYAEAHNNLGFTLAGQGRVEEAIAHFQKALEIKPDYAEAYNNLANLLAGCGRVEEAIAHYQKALEIKPDYAKAHNNLGVALADCGRVEEAIAQYQKALEIEPDYAEAHNNLGVALADRGRVEEAIAQYQKALEIKPDFARARNNLADALASRGRGEQAIPQSRKTPEIAPDDAQARQKLEAVQPSGK